MSDGDNIHGMTRAELDERAARLGIEDPAGFPNKAALVDEIEAREQATRDREAATTEVADANVRADTGAFDAGMAKVADAVGRLGAQATGERYRVVKAITIADGSTIMPGEEIDASRLGPARRPKQLVDLGYLRPIKE